MLDGAGDPPTPAFVDGAVTVYASDGWLPDGHRHRRATPSTRCSTTSTPSPGTSPSRPTSTGTATPSWRRSAAPWPGVPAGRSRSAGDRASCTPPGSTTRAGPHTGVYLQVTGQPAADLAVPDRPFTFHEFLTAQAVGDGQVLADHGRPVLRLHVSGPADLADLHGGAGVTPPTDPNWVNPLRDPAGPAAAADRRPLRDGALRRHRRPVPQEGDAGDLRPGQPRPAATRLQPGRLRPARLGQPGLRADRARLGQGVRPHRVPRGGLAPAVRGLPVRPRRLRRRRRLRQAAAHHRGARPGPRHRRQPRVLPRHPARRSSATSSGSSRSTASPAPPATPGGGWWWRSRSGTTWSPRAR